MKPFAESDFVVTFSGESPGSRLVPTWPLVLEFINVQCGIEDEWVDRCKRELDDPDAWTHLAEDAGDGDTRHVFCKPEFDYCDGLTITRLTDVPVSTPAK